MFRINLTIIGNLCLKQGEIIPFLLYIEQNILHLQENIIFDTMNNEFMKK